jgi:hypothetical protein
MPIEEDERATTKNLISTHKKATGPADNNPTRTVLLRVSSPSSEKSCS